MQERLDFIVRKIGFIIVTLIGVIIFNFFLFRILPGDPVQMVVPPHMGPESKEVIRRLYGLDKPIWFNIEAVKSSGDIDGIFESQFFYYIRNLVKGEFGLSFRQRKPVAELIGERLGATVLLILTGEVAGIVLGTVLGMIAAWKKKSAIDAGIMFVSLTAWALPAFWLGIILLILGRGHLPMAGMMTPGTIYGSILEQVQDIGRHIIMPATTLAIMLFGSYMLIVRNSNLEVLAEDYILTAKAKGLSPIQILIHHAFKNASLPLITIIAMDLGIAMGGTIQIEMIFSWPGIGRLMFDAISYRDYPILQAVFLILAVSVICANFLADLTYVILDPRVKA